VHVVHWRDASLQLSRLAALSFGHLGGAVGRVDVPQDDTIPSSQLAFYHTVIIAVAPLHVFDWAVRLDARPTATGR